MTKSLQRALNRYLRVRQQHRAVQRDTRGDGSREASSSRIQAEIDMLWAAARVADALAWQERASSASQRLARTQRLCRQLGVAVPTRLPPDRAGR